MPRESKVLPARFADAIGSCCLTNAENNGSGWYWAR
jgi:hypothetical protein